MNPVNDKSIKETRNNCPLYKDRVTSPGIFVAIPATTAPIPIATKRAGRAQQSSVPILVKRLKKTIGR
jgi:hypothetical protein